MHQSTHQTKTLTRPIQALVAPLIQRLYDFADDDVFPASLPNKLDRLPNFSRWAKACRSHESVMFNWEPGMMLQRVKERMGRMRPSSTA
ncbi:hypothetical protein GJ744_001727 [Endocarpon pusillum]|uniref:Uncharacterized protein n=1 Tax=Endocarpon pusillum TaxID=364733 RepID=A0A8H7AB74_9EURO|nr:hypothetical protein GJ744_001727 [Endocarpon pusillum]